MESLIQGWDGESVVVHHDRASGTWMFIAIHDRSLGMALGGCRMHVYGGPREGLADALRLARGMTMKWAALDFPFGGGKAVLAVPEPLRGPVRERLLVRFGQLVDSLGGNYGTGTDLGTGPTDMDVVRRRTAWVFGTSVEHGGSGDPGPWTALGVYSALQAASARAFGTEDVAGRSVLIQGVGGVGAPLARLVAEAGARVLVSDALPKRAASVAAELGAGVVGPDQVYDTECDIFAPCAIGGILNARSIPRLRCRIVVGSANNQLEEEVADAERLHQRGILYAPDFVANAGGAIALAAFEVLRWSRERVVRRVREVGQAVGLILDDALRADETPLHQASRRAEAVLARARFRTPGDPAAAGAVPAMVRG